MEYVKLGRTGLDVSRLCLGCMTYGVAERGNHSWTLDEAASKPLLNRALDLGINFLDTANVYSDGTSEEFVGRVLKEHGQRDRVVLATKVHGRMHEGPNGMGLSRKAIMAEIDHSLRRLGTDYVDLYQIHRWDPHTPIEETMEALHDVVKAGKARYIGASSMYAWQFAKAQHVAERHGWTRFVSMQNHYNLLYREEEREMMPLCQDSGVGGDPVESAGARPPHPRLGRADRTHPDRRIRQDAVQGARRRPSRGGSGCEIADAARGAAGAGGAGMDAVQAVSSPRRSSAPPRRRISMMRWQHCRWTFQARKSPRWKRITCHMRSPDTPDVWPSICRSRCAHMSRWRVGSMHSGNLRNPLAPNGLRYAVTAPIFLPLARATA